MTRRREFLASLGAFAAAAPRGRGWTPGLRAGSASSLTPGSELADDGSPEAGRRRRYAELARRGLRAATDSASPDFLNFARGRQPLVDAAFLAHAIVRAPGTLWEQLDAGTRRNVVAALK